MNSAGPHSRATTSQASSRRAATPLATAAPPGNELAARLYSRTHASRLSSESPSLPDSRSGLDSASLMLPSASAAALAPPPGGTLVPLVRPGVGGLAKSRSAPALARAKPLNRRIKTSRRPQNLVQQDVLAASGSLSGSPPKRLLQPVALPQPLSPARAQHQERHRHAHHHEAWGSGSGSGSNNNNAAELDAEGEELADEHKAVDYEPSTASSRFGATPPPAAEGDAAAAAAAAGDDDALFQTFTASLQLDSRYMDEFLAGNFLYLRPKAGMGRTAYDLETVEHYETKPDDYFTMSRAGITHFMANDSDFTSLDQWEREYYLFNRIRRIPFFSKYRVWKSFTEWKRNVRSTKVRDSSEKLQRELFLSIPALQNALMELRRLCSDAEKLRLVEFDNASTYTLEGFCDAQLQVQQRMTESLTDFSSRVRRRIRLACDEVIDQFLRDNNIIADHKMTFMERAALRTECRRLTKFLRLVDFLIIDMLRALALDSVRDILVYVQSHTAAAVAAAAVAAERAAEKAALLAVVSGEAAAAEAAENPQVASGGPEAEAIAEAILAERAAAEKKLKQLEEDEAQQAEADAAAAALQEKQPPLFEIEVSFDYLGELYLSPTCDKFKERIENVIYESLHVISVPERVLGHEDLEAYVMTEADDGDDGNADEVNLETLVMSDENFDRTTEQIYDRLDEAFDCIGDYTEVFLPYRDLFLENESYQSEVFELYKDAPLVAFAEAINKYRGQAVEFEDIPDSEDVGIIRVDSQDLKMKLMPSPVQCLYALRDLLPRLMHAASKSLLDELAELLPVITGSPMSVEEFVHKTTVLERVVGSLEQLKARDEKIRKMAELMDMEEWPIPDEEKAHMVMVAENMAQLETGIQAAEGSIDSDTKHFAQTVTDEIPQLKKKVVSVREKLDASIIADTEVPLDEVLAYLAEQERDLTELKNRAGKLQEYQTILKQDVEEYDTLDEAWVDLQLKLKLWNGVKEWERLTKSWVDLPFVRVDAAEMDREIQTYNKVCLQAAKGLPGNMVVNQLKQTVDQWKPVLPVVVDLRNESLRDRHWDQIHSLVGFEIQGDETFTLGNLIERRVVDYVEEISTVAVAAQQEAVLEEMLAKVSKIWADTEFEVNPYKDNVVKDLYILGGVDDVVANLEDSLVTVNTILGSRFVAGIRDEVEGWQQKLMLLSETLDEWIQVQRNWMYLENIFNAGDIQRQLPVAYNMFAGVDKSWKEVMRRTLDEPNALKAGTHPGLRDMFRSHNTTLDRIQKSLEDYLETKRSSFPRFYFLSNDELLEILAQSKNPQAVQPHLRKCFDNLIALDFGDDKSSIDIHAMISGEGERVPLGKNLKARGNVEDWLCAVEANMKTALHKLMKAGLGDLTDSGKARSAWLFDHPGQIVATVAQMAWAGGTELALNQANPLRAMKEWFQTALDELQHLIVLIRGDLSKIHRKIIVALVTTDVHARDIVEKLWEDKVSSTSNFTWQQQLRYYWDRELDDCLIKHSDSKIRYGYEYMGATSRLVITPLTDRCWMTLTGSYALKLGAAPAGPAGTGKTESSKDLAKAMGILCVVFNCSDQIDYKMMGKLFRGLAQAGVWTCLDEFNRIDIEVLSVIAQQLLVLREGRLEGKAHINFMGDEIRLLDHHVIVTMNPGYAGRTELPDNLQVCFRPVAMMVPDYALIAEIMLFAEGFGDAKALSRKMCKLYILSSEQLSQQPHYDYGLRAVKSVLVMAGSLKRANPDLSEDVTLIRALRDSNVPKFLSQDLPLFFAILGDLFPGIEVPFNDYGQLQVALEEEIAKANLQPVPAFITKVIQLFDVFEVRFGASIVGPTGSGKSTCYRMLQNTMTNLRQAGNANEAYQVVHTQILNPKCISMGELYGEFNEITQEWHDGLASTIMRAAVNETGDDKRWTVFDGPIDALWIENMNTVLDDNMTLCLANGERIKLKVEMKMLFEVMDLAVASPATVSRIGVLYMTPTDLGWRPYVRTWLKTCLPEAVSEAVRDYLWLLFDKTIDQGLRWLRRVANEPVKTVDVQMATSLCKLLESMFTESNGCNLGAGDEELKKLLTKLFVFCYVWSIGSSSTADSWDSFDDLVRRVFDEAEIATGLPNSGQVFDYYVNIKDKEFRGWSDLVPAFQYDKEAPYFALMVPTIDTVRYSYIVRTLIVVDKPAFITGVTGTGKTCVMQNLLTQLQETPENGGLDVTPVFINFSAQTSSLITQSSIESKLEKKRKTLLGAPAGRRVVVFVDDVNMPFVEEYGAQPPIELLRQFLDFKGFYDRDKLFWKDVSDTVLMVGAAPPGGGRNEVTPRFVRHFNVLCMQPAADEVLNVIFGGILGGFMDAWFMSNQEIKALRTPIVRSTVEIYKSISRELLPTPAKSHYTFNLRDISKVFQGVLMIRPRKCQTADAMVRLWVHESQRVFYDRLINRDDQAWFTGAVLELVNRQFRMGLEHKDLFSEENPIMFGDFLKPGVEVREYEECKSTEQVVPVLDDYLDEYNISNANNMNLVFFKDAVEHVARISRIIRQPRGNAMLVGVGGSGKQSLTRLAAAMSEYSCFQIELVRGYGITEFREDIKTLMVRTGVEGTPTVFLFTDTQIVTESFLEDINNVLNAGEVPNLFPQDELDKILGDMREVVKAMGLPESRDVCYSTFVSRVRDLLHIVLCMSPVGDSLRVRCRQFPSLINCTTIDWFMEWPKAALVSVAQRFLGTLELPSDEVRFGLIEMCGEVHQSIVAKSDDFWDELRRRVYTTPKSYLDLISLYISMLNEKRQEMGKVQQRMEVGVKKLADTNAMVEGLQGDLTALGPVLAEKTVAAEQLLKQVAEDQAAASVVQERVAKDEAEVQAQAAEVGLVQADAQRDLDVAMPALESAVNALNSLDKKDITEVKSFAKPPEAVQVVMEAVCILLGHKTDWDAAKKVLGDPQFMDKLRNYDKDNIAPAMLKKLKKYIEHPIMAIDVVKKVSKAATSLCMWVHAMDVYSKVAKEVGPKKERLEAMNTALAAANGVLAEKQAELKAVNDRVAALQKSCDETVAEKNSLEREAEATRQRLVRAEKLISGLSKEGERWIQTVADLGVAVQALMGDTFLAAACISYYGPFTGKYREELIVGWHAGVREAGIPCSERFTLLNTVGDPVQVRDWQLKGLPTDDVSTDSAILVMRGKRWPLMIDPQSQANRWIKNMEAENNLEVVTMTNPNLLRSLENCIRVGKPLLIEDIDEALDPALEPILQKAIFKQGGRTLIRLGDTDVDYDPNFRFYLTTKLPNPHYFPEVCIKVTVINFTVTMAGLEDQLLGNVVKLERPDIEERKTRLLLSMAADKKQLKDIEDRILKQLSEASGNILDNVDLINTLADSNTTSGIIKERVEESEKTQVEINAARESYRPVATRGAIIYFVVADLASIDPMYQYSLEYFVKLFDQCMDNKQDVNALDQRLAFLIQYITEVIYGNICRGLFEAHKTLFSSLVCFQVLRNSGHIRPAEWSAFLRGASALGVDQEFMLECPVPDRVLPQQWQLLHAIEHAVTSSPPGEGEGDGEGDGDGDGDGEEFYPFAGITQSIIDSPSEWAAWYDHPELVGEALPCGFAERCNHFHKMLLVKALRDEKVLTAVTGFVATHLGQRFVESPSATMEEIYADLDSCTPCIFVLSTGADPTGMLLRFAKDFGYGDRLSVISLGQGQGPLAANLIEAACKTGDWVLLQNCMLAKSWMPALEKIVMGLKENVDTISPDFRLYLTSAPALYFPVSVLQTGLKMTNEPPKGIRANILRSFNTLITPEDYDSGCPRKPEAWKKLLMGLCMFHSQVQERRKFGPLGWNIRYAFDDSDLETSIAVLKRFLEEQDEIPWDALCYVTGEINYGGRVTDDWDRRCLMSVLGKYFVPSILDDKYRFSSSGLYYAPKAGTHAQLKTFLQALPATDDPDIFGMHSNANVTFEKNESNALISIVLGLQPRAAGGGSGKTPDDIVFEVCSDMEEAMPEELDVEQAHPTTFALMPNGLMDSLATVLSQEIVKFNRLVSRCRSTLAELKRAIKGFVVMSGDLDKMHSSVLNNQVPELWSAVGFASLKGLASWVADLQFRVAFMRRWIEEGPPPAYPLPVFFFPQGFMTGVLQTFSRKYEAAIDSLSFTFNVLDGEADEITEGPDDGVYVFGLWMEGARWNRERRVIEQSRPKEMYASMAPVHFTPASNHKPNKRDYAVPVYKTSERKGALSTTGLSTNFVVAIWLPTDVDPDKWTSGGVAFLLNLD